MRHRPAKEDAMRRITVHLDDDTERRLRRAAAAAGVSPSRWVAGLIRQATRDEWPESVKRLAGAWPDFPTLEEIRADPPRRQ